MHSFLDKGIHEGLVVEKEIIEAHVVAPFHDKTQFALASARETATATNSTLYSTAFHHTNQVSSLLRSETEFNIVADSWVAHCRPTCIKST